MIDHNARISGLVRAHLKTLALGQAAGSAVTQGYVLTVDQHGEQALKVGWLVMVTIPQRIRLLGVPDSDIGVTVPIAGVLPPDDIFRQAVSLLLEKCRALAQADMPKPAIVGGSPMLP